LTFPFTKAWKPSKDENTEYIKIILADEHLITGIEISGRETFGRNKDYNKRP
jgi:hypothetical protein